MEPSLQLFNNLLSNYKLIGKESLTMVEIDNLLSQVNDLVNSSNVKEEIMKDFATKEQRDTFNEIMSKFTGTMKLDDCPDVVFYMVGDKVYMERFLKTGDFYIRYNDFWKVFETKFNLNYQEISDLLKGLLEEHLKCNVKTTKINLRIYIQMLEEHLKCNVKTTLHLL